MGSLTIPVAGMQTAAAQFDRAASRLAKTASIQGSGDIVDLSAEMVALMAARNAYAINAEVAQSEAELQETTLSILA